MGDWKLWQVSKRRGCRGKATAMKGMWRREARGHGDRPRRHGRESTGEEVWQKTAALRV